MTKYKWSLLGLILSIILFIVFLISPLINFIDDALVPTKHYRPPIEIFITEDEELAEKCYKAWYKNVPKKFNWSALSEFGKSFYHWNLFWIPIIVFSFMTFNYKKINK